MNPEIVKAAEILSKVEKGNVGIAGLFIETHDKIDEISTTTDQKIKEIKVIAETTAKQKGEKGDKGDKGDNGKDGRNGLDGKDGKNGRDGVDGLNGLDGKDGIDGKDGLDGKDGSQDTGEQIVDKINSQDTLIKAEKVEGLKDFKKDIKELKERPATIIQGVGGGASGVRDIRGGTNVTVTKVNEIYTVSATGGGAVDSVNGQTGVVVLDTDDIADTATNRYTNDTDITRLANTSGTNTGDQVADGVTITGTGTVGDPFVSVGGGGVTDGDKGDITVSSSGTVWTVDNGLAATKIADGTVSNTEFQYINSLTSNAQDQLDDKLPYTIPDDTNKDLFQYRPATLNSINGTGTILVLLDDTSTTINKYYSGVIRGHNYTGRNEFVIKFGGLWYATGGPTYTTASPSFISVEGNADFGSVRLAYDASNRPCLLIGTTSYVWHQDSRVTLEQLYSSYSDLTEYQRIRDNAPVQTVTRITSEAGYAVKETKAVAAVNGYTNTSLIKVWGGATPLDYRYSIYNPINLHSGSNTTGTVAIKLPAFVNTVYNIIEVRGFDYTSTTGGWRVTVSGLTNGTSWINSSVNVEGKPPFTTVRLAYIGADYCILLGTTTTAWSRMNISLDLHHKVGASTDPIYTNATDYSITTAITSEASYSIKATYDCAFNAQRMYKGDGTAALPAGSYYGDTDTGDFRPSANVYAVATGGTERFRVDSTGFGVGTTSPSQMSDVVNNQNAGTYSRVGNNSTGTAGIAGFFASATNANTYFMSHGSGRTALRYGTSLADASEILSLSGATKFFIGTGTLNIPTIFGTNNAEVFRMTGNTITMAESNDIATGTTTGSKIGTATTQKIGFWNVTPVVQQVTAAYTSDGEGVAYTGVDNLQVGNVYATVADLNQLRVAYETLRASYDDLLTKLKNTGIVA